MIPPFVWVGGTVYTVVNFDLEQPLDSTHYLLLRPMESQEFARLRAALEDLEADLWARMVPNEDSRFGPR